ncbi:hypothetical protein LUZ63_013391 [Rhynchospora breviuscula]|uniref:RRM domain-containing protein n=1 Tax=Rhynchospora breviuscula TaxID=2022672 RepID=A0A9Q0C8G6_9POAL|nr:hypothetical protein LUZ63_013391 [Rhynchospora breviuscula]
MAAQPRLTLMGGGGSGSSSSADTTYTKIFVGGLAWETQRDTMRRYFEQFGEILEAVVITDKNTGRSKGYGFVTFKDAESAFRALQDPTPVIDGRRANCNLAAFGASQPQVPSAPQFGMVRFRPVGSNIPSSMYHGSAAMGSYLQQPGQFPFPYYSYGFSGGAYSQENMYPMSYYGALYSGSGGQQQAQVPAYYAAAGPGVYQNMNPAYYSQLLQSNQAQSGYGLQYATQMLQYPYLPQQQQQYGSASLPSPLPSSTTGLLSNTTGTGIGSSSTHLNSDKRP